MKKKYRQFGCLAIIALVILCYSFQPAHAEDGDVASPKALTHYTMGVIYDFYGMTEQAIIEYKKALSVGDTSHMTHFKLGSNYARLGMLEEATKELNRVTASHPDDLQSHYLLALIYSTQKEYTKAAQEYEIILKSFSSEDPDNVEIYGYLGQLYYSQGKYSEAIGQFEKIYVLEPDNPDVMYLLGSLYLEVDERQRAIDLFIKAIDVDPQHDGSLNSLGYVYAEDEVKLDEALLLVEKAIEIDPENGAYLDSLGWVYYKKGMYKEALKYLNQADKYLQDPVVYEHMGDVYVELKQPENAKKYWRLSLELLPNQAHVIEKIHQVEQQQSSLQSSEE